ncbi:MAG TPA: thioredoxin domain-containing protein [Longimicrobiales bacterium]|nr:thioredoxin domain-containing protein [Longimicrobiales bacterium]
MQMASVRRCAAALPAVLLLMVAASTPTSAQQQQQSGAQTLLERAAESRSKGSPDAPVLVFEISDFQCPHCRRFALDVFPRIDSAYVQTNRVQWVFVSLPMPSHTNAWVAHEAAACAGAVGDRFWEMKERVFRNQEEWAEAADPGALMERYARAERVPMEAWTACVQLDRVAAMLLQDVFFGSRVSGTPTFIINNQQTVVGVKSFAEWREILETALKQRRD